MLTPAKTIMILFVYKYDSVSYGTVRSEVVSMVFQCILQADFLPLKKNVLFGFSMELFSFLDFFIQLFSYLFNIDRLFNKVSEYTPTQDITYER